MVATACFCQDAILLHFAGESLQSRFKTITITNANFGQTGAFFLDFTWAVMESQRKQCHTGERFMQERVSGSGAHLVFGVGDCSPVIVI
jgi:hypothetical protein